jgi:hypothetical protein
MRLQKSMPALYLTALLFAAATTMIAQVTGQNVQTNSDGTYTITAGTQLVVETVIAKDKKGNFINGLTAKDFTITEDGAPQTIQILRTPRASANSHRASRNST